MGREAQKYLKDVDRRENRNGGQRFGQHILNQEVSLRHQFVVDKKYRGEVIEAMREAFPDSPGVDIERYYKRIIK